jgi:hypothetical protein
MTYYEAWEVRDGKIGITLNGKFCIAAEDTFMSAGWDASIKDGSTVTIKGTTIFVKDAKITDEYKQNATSWSGDLPYAEKAPKAWDSTGGLVRTVTLTYDAKNKQWSYQGEPKP